MANSYVVALSCVVASSLLHTSCCGGGGECTATGTYKNANVTSNGSGSKARAEAEEGFCMIYCADHDSVVDAAYRKWKATPEGSASKTDRWFDVSSEPSLKLPYAVCQDACNKDRAAGKIQIRTVCK